MEIYRTQVDRQFAAEGRCGGESGGPDDFTGGGVGSLSSATTTSTASASTASSALGGVLV